MNIRSFLEKPSKTQKNRWKSRLYGRFGTSDGFAKTQKKTQNVRLRTVRGERAAAAGSRLCRTSAALQVPCADRNRSR